MRNCFCRKCGTQNTIEDGELTYFCASCGQQNNVPKAAAPVNNETPQYKMPEQAATIDNIYAPVQETYAPVQETVAPTPEPVQNSYVPNQNSYVPENNMYTAGTTTSEAKPKKKKKAGLVIFLLVLIILIAGAVVALISPIKTPITIKFRCEECGKFKKSYEYHLDDVDKDRYLCDDCLEDLGYAVEEDK